MWANAKDILVRNQRGSKWAKPLPKVTEQHQYGPTGRPQQECPPGSALQETSTGEETWALTHP